jgi:cytochrome c biogenesis protein CcmG/thiol:disulfide interchange protein DsbE
MRSAITRLVLAAVVAGAALAVVLLLTRGPSPAADAVSTDPNAWALPRLNGPGQVRVSSFRGRPLVLDFFASWCDSCETELPAFADLSKRLSGGVSFAGVDSEETGDGLAMATRLGIGGWPLARDVGGRELSGLRDALEPTPGMPITAFYDSGGHLLHVQLGALSGDELAAQIDRLYHLRPA